MRVKISIILLLLALSLPINLGATDVENLRIGGSCISLEQEISSSCSIKVFDTENNQISSGTKLSLGTTQYKIENLVVTNGGQEIPTYYSFNQDTNILEFVKDTEDQDLQIVFTVSIDEITNEMIYNLGTQYVEESDSYESIVNYYYDVDNSNTYDSETDIKASFIGLEISFGETDVIFDLNIDSNEGELEIKDLTNTITLNEENEFTIQFTLENTGFTPLLISELGISELEYNDENIKLDEVDGSVISFEGQSYQEYLLNNSDILKSGEEINVSISGTSTNYDEILTVNFNNPTNIFRQEASLNSESSYNVNFEASEVEEETTTEISETGLENNILLIISLGLIIISMFLFYVKRGIR